MADFKTLEEAQAMFREADSTREIGNIFVTYKNTNREGFAAGLAGGMAGAGLPGIYVNNRTAEAIIGGNFTGLLINEIDEGFGLIPLMQKGVQLTLNVDKMVAEPENYMFISREAITGIKVKNFAFLNKSTQAVTLELGKPALHLMARCSLKSVAYQEPNFKLFMDKYKKK